MKFKYRISSKTITRLNSAGVFLKDASNNNVSLCNGTKVLKCLVSNRDGMLTIDPWKIMDHRIDTTTLAVDPCYGNVGVINAATPYPLSINIQRGYTRALNTAVLVGHPTKQISLHYQTWLIGVNTLGAKFRPRVTDINGKEYSANVLTGSINAGVTLGYSYGWTTFTHRSTNSFSITPTFAIGLASASLSKEPLKKQVVTTYNPSNFILSPSVGFIVARNDIGLFFAYGSDLMMGANSSAWAYQGKRFLGVGLSASFKL